LALYAGSQSSHFRLHLGKHASKVWISQDCVWFPN